MATRRKASGKSSKGKSAGKSSRSKPARRTARPLARRKAGKAKGKPAASARKPAKPRARVAAGSAQLEANKKLVLAFYEQIIGRKDFDAALPYMGDTYRQHAPYAADGHDGLRAWLAGFKAAFPNHRYEVKRVIAEGPYVMLHLHGMGGPNPHGEAVIDIFRIENGKVVEHWDIIQPIPDSADNANSMF